MKKILSLIMIFTFCLMSSAAFAFEVPANFPKMESPILLTSIGQAADVHTTSVLAKKAGISLVYEKFATADMIKNSKSILICVGVSLKGFGSAGVNLESETARAKELFQIAKENKIPVTLIHIGGGERRDNMSNLILDATMPNADAYIVYSEGDKDGYFTKNASDKPIVLLAKTMEMLEVFKLIAPK